MAHVVGIDGADGTVRWDVLANGGNDAMRGDLALQAPGGEEQLVPDGESDRKDHIDQETDTAALAEGRLDPPASTREEP